MEDRTLTTRVILVRHGQSTYNKQRRIQGRLDESVITDVGRVTAKQVAATLSGIRLDAIYCSPLKRANETADVIWSSLPEDARPAAVQPTDRLMEIDLPLWAGKRRDEVREKFAQDYRCWQERPHEFRMLLHGESGAIEHFPVLTLHEQARQFWDELLSRHTEGTVLVVAHNGINRCLLSTALGISPAYYHSIQQSNCAISVLNFSTPRVPLKGKVPVQLESMNVTSHVGQVLPTRRPDHRGPRLILVRHGETEWNRQQRFQGQIDVPLNENGKAQSAKAAEYLKDQQIDFAVSSSMLRPKETGEIILQHHPHVELKLHDGLREISHGLWEGKFESDIEREFPGMLKEWKEAPETVQMPEGENLQQVWDRCIAAWREIVASAPEGSTGMVVGHDAINKAILCHLFGLGPEYFWCFKQGNGAITAIDYPNGPDGPPVLTASNITTHFGSVLDTTAAGAL